MLAFRKCQFQLIALIGFVAAVANDGGLAAGEKKPLALASTPAEANERLHRLVDVDMEDLPVDQLPDHLEQIVGITVSFIRGRGKLSTETVSFRARQMPVEDVLDLMLEPIQYYWSLKGATLVISPDAQRGDALVTEVYDVYDLVFTGDDSRREEFDFDGLIQVITSTIEPATWSQVGGIGWAKGFSSKGRAALVVSQTPKVQRRIADLLERLRAVPPEPTEAKPGRPQQPSKPQGSARPKSGTVGEASVPDWWPVLASQIRKDFQAQFPNLRDKDVPLRLLAWQVRKRDGIVTLDALVWTTHPEYPRKHVWQLADYISLPFDKENIGDQLWRRDERQHPARYLSPAQHYARPPTNQDVDRYLRFLGELGRSWSFKDEQNDVLLAGEVREQTWQDAIGEPPGRRFPADLPRRFDIPDMDLATAAKDQSDAEMEKLEHNTDELAKQVRSLSATLDRLRQQQSMAPAGAPK